MVLASRAAVLGTKEMIVRKIVIMDTMEWNVARNVAHFAKSHVTVILYLDIVQMAVKADGKDLIA